MDTSARVGSILPLLIQFIMNCWIIIIKSCGVQKVGWLPYLKIDKVWRHVWMKVEVLLKPQWLGGNAAFIVCASIRFYYYSRSYVAALCCAKTTEIQYMLSKVNSAFFHLWQCSSKTTFCLGIRVTSVVSKGLASHETNGNGNTGLQTLDNPTYFCIRFKK